MNRKNAQPLVAVLFILAMIPAVCHIVVAQTTTTVGIFDGHGDVGNVLHPGSAEYDAANKTYTIAGSGNDLWFSTDEFQFAWKRVSGDVAFAADISFAGTGGNAHRKAVLVFRQSLDADSAYADVALHGDGLTSLQYRDEKGVATHEIQSNISAPKRLRLEKRGDYVYLWLAEDGTDLKPAGASIRVPLTGDFYVGIGVCSHDKDVVEKAVFSNVSFESLMADAGKKPTLYSTLETVTIADLDRRVVYVAPDRFEAPNWTHDGGLLVFNRNGRIERIPAQGGQPISDRHRVRQPLQQRPRHFARRHAARHQRSVAGKSRISRLSGALRRGHAAAYHKKLAFLLAWLVAGREHAGFRRPPE